MFQYEDEDEDILPAEEALEEPDLTEHNLLEGVEQLKLDLAQPPTEPSLGADYDLFKDLKMNNSHHDDQLIPGLDLSPLSPISPTPKTDDLIGIN